MQLFQNRKQSMRHECKIKSNYVLVITYYLLPIRDICQNIIPTIRVPVCQIMEFHKSIMYLSQENAGRYQRRKSGFL